MDEKDILAHMHRISNLLEKTSGSLDIDDWENVEKWLAQVDEIQAAIKNNSIPVETLLARDPSFKKEYAAIKEKLMEQIRQNYTTIEEWKAKQTAKIAGSRNVLDNITRYYNAPNTSYYIDKAE